MIAKGKVGWERRILPIMYIAVLGIIGLAIIGFLGGYPVYNYHKFLVLPKTDKIFSIFLSVIFSAIGIGYVAAGVFAHRALRKNLE